MFIYNVAFSIRGKTKVINVEASSTQEAVKQARKSLPDDKTCSFKYCVEVTK